MTSFPRQLARTRRFTLGVPRGFVAGVGPNGPVVLFLRTDSGDDPVTHLWRHDPATGRTHKLVDARDLGDDGELPREERARRERTREQAGGIVGYAVDDRLSVAAFALAGRLHTVDVATGDVAEHPTAGPAFDPRPSPDGRWVAYHALDGAQVIELTDGPAVGGRTRELVSEPGVSWGRAEFVAAEEMGRARGMWWSGDSTRIAVTRVDETAVARWTIADPANPWADPTTHRYPAAGAVNAEVSLWVVDVRGGRTEVRWDRTGYEYLAGVDWGHDPLTLLVQPRDQRSARIMTADPDRGTTTVVREWTDRAWVELVPGSPAWLGERLVTVEDLTEAGEVGTRALCVDGEQVTPPGLQVRELLATEEREAEVVFLASPADAPTRVDVHRIVLTSDGRALAGTSTEDLPAGIRRVVPGRVADPGGPRVSESRVSESLHVSIVSTLAEPAPTVTVHWRRRTGPGEGPPAVSVAGPDLGDDGADVELQLEVVAETPALVARPRMLRLGERGLRAALLLPTDDAGGGRLPVVLDPYGGPHAQRVVDANAAYLGSQWLADQGFAVLVVDGRGSPGRGPLWEREIHRDLATPVLVDQIDALHAVARLEARLDLSRVGIRGWSYGGYLAALAVLRRPDVFRAGVAGAPVTDWRLYDTHYTERYLGHPDHEPDAYAVSSLVDADGALSAALPWDPLDPPGLLLIHGLADDNVVAAHSLRLSSAMLAEGRSHTFLPLSGVTHMTPQEVVAEQLLLRQVDFLREHLQR